MCCGDDKHIWDSKYRLKTALYLCFSVLFHFKRKAVVLCYNFLKIFSVTFLISPCLKVPDRTCVGVIVSYCVLTSLSSSHQAGRQDCCCQTPVSWAQSKQAWWLSNWVALWYPMAHLGHAIMAPLRNAPLNTVCQYVQRYQSRISFCHILWWSGNGIQSVHHCLLQLICNTKMQVSQNSQKLHVFIETGEHACYSGRDF